MTGRRNAAARRVKQRNLEPFFRAPDSAWLPGAALSRFERSSRLQIVDNLHPASSNRNVLKS
ncbi:MAG: hypothetical protein ACM34F_15695, partial [Betaproteobacteria bacterium]